MNKPLAVLAAFAVLAIPGAAQADRAWMLPSSTSLSGAEGWIAIDAGMSDNLFVADHAAMRLDNLVITAPDGSTAAPENLMRGRYRSTFDVHLTQPGTWKIANVTSGMNARYMLNGVEGRWRGPAQDFPAALPAGATDIQATFSANRIETFVTLGATTDTVFVPTGTGLELVPVTHPGDLAAGEAASFRLLRDGRPAPGLTVTIGRGGARYRDALEDMTTITDGEGLFAVTWPEAGMYWINAVIRTEADGSTPASTVQYSGVVEVLP